MLIFIKYTNQREFCLIVILINFSTLRQRTQTQLPCNVLQRSPAGTLGICQTDSSSMKGIHTWGRRSSPCVTRGEWGQIWTLWVDSVSKAPPLPPSRWQIHPERTQLHDLQEVWLDGRSSNLWRWGFATDWRVIRRHPQHSPVTPAGRGVT